MRMLPLYRGIERPQILSSIWPNDITPNQADTRKLAGRAEKLGLLQAARGPTGIKQ